MTQLKRKSSQLRFSSMTRALFLLIFCGILIAACGEDVGTTTTVSTTTSSTTVDSSAPSTTAPVPTTAPPSTVDTSTSTTTTTLPGEEIEFGPAAGDLLMVIGVAFDDHLNLREAPGTAYDVIARIPSDHLELVALGHTRDIGRSFWIEVEFGGVVGWVHMGFIAFQGVTDDLTAFVVQQMGERPSAGTMTDLGRIVAEQFVSQDVQSDVVKVVDETMGELGEVTFDVVGLADDSVIGLRLHVFGEPFEGGFALRTVEVTYLCGRGVTDERICV